MSFGRFNPNTYALLASSQQQASRPQMGPAAPITQMGPPAPIRGQSAMQKALSELDLSQLDSDKAAREDLLQQKQEERQAFLKQQKQDRTKDILFAIGGALQGDKQFVEKTLQLREMREGKRKQQKQDKVWKETLEEAKKNPNISPTMFRMLEALPRKEAMDFYMETLKGPELTAAQKELSELRTIERTYGKDSEEYKRAAIKYGAVAKTKSKEDFVLEMLKKLPEYNINDEVALQDAKEIYEKIYDQVSNSEVSNNEVEGYKIKVVK